MKDTWEFLREYTSARIALGRCGQGLPVREVLRFRLAHAQARDAVHEAFDPAMLASEIGERCLVLKSQASDRNTYLRRPDLGRRLDKPSRDRLLPLQGAYDAAFVIAGGLSPGAVLRHAVPVLCAALKRIEDWRIAPVTVIEHGRVAIGDEVGHLLGAEMVAVLIGERPGLSSPRSLGIYLTYAPRPGRTDAERTCISNIHDHGLGHEEAAERLVCLMGQARRLRLTGVAPRPAP
jgi:ethanolamine ammonia-lyase small subunit